MTLKRAFSASSAFPKRWGLFAGIDSRCLRMSSTASPRNRSTPIFPDGLVQERQETAAAPARAPRDSGGRVGEVRSLRPYRHPRKVRAEFERLPQLRLSSPHSGSRLLHAAA